MAYSEKEKEEKFTLIVDAISKGVSLRAALKDYSLSSQTFFIWIDSDDAKSKRYARACTERADVIFEDILNIADDTSSDTSTVNLGGIEVEQTNHEAIQRSRLKVDARKWMLGKMNPKKYGESSLLKLANNDGDELKVNAIFSTDLVHVPTDESPD